MLFSSSTVQKFSARIWMIGAIFLSFTFASVMQANATPNVGSVITNSIPANNDGTGVRGSINFTNALKLVEAGEFVRAYNMARGFSDPVERRAVQWAAIYYGGGEIDAQSVSRFSADAPQYATTRTYKARMELALVENAAPYNEVISLLGGEMPRTINGQIALAKAYATEGQAERGLRIARQIWTTNFLTREQEDEVRASFGRSFTRDDYWKRSVNLLMNDRAKGAERIMSFLSPAQKSLVVARVAVARKTSNAQRLLDRVDPAYRDHPLFYFSQGQLARRAGRLTSAVETLNKASAPLPNSSLWWNERRLLARKLVAAGRYQTAYNAAAAYNTGPEGRVVDANFHAGWIALTFLNDPQTAVRHFERMRSLSTLATTISQSNYWLGRAYGKLGDQENAQNAFARAALHQTTYYGQLSRYRLGNTAIEIRAMPAWQGNVEAFNARQLVRAVRLLAANGKPQWAEKLLSRLIYQISEPGEMLLTARLAQEIKAHNLAIIMASVANRKGVALDLFNYPRDGIPDNARLANIDPAAIYAVARQESRFDIDAISSAGARGVMQLMPATAKETANLLGIEYSPSRLTTDAAYNAYLGSTYLSRQLSRYEGSFILAAAAYNAGGGNVNKWIRAFGNPTSPGVDPVVWIEQIPFVETRKYVKRVVANYMIYRERLGQSDVTIAQVLRRIGT